MKKFFFNLQTVMDVRRIQRDIKAGEVGRLLWERNEQADILSRCQAKWEEACQKTPVLKQGSLLHALYYQEQVHKDIQAQMDILSERETLLKNAREQLTKAEANCSSLELLKEKEKNLYCQEVLKEEQNLLDEAGINGFIRSVECR